MHIWLYVLSQIDVQICTCIHIHILNMNITTKLKTISWYIYLPRAYHSHLMLLIHGADLKSQSLSMMMSLMLLKLSTVVMLVIRMHLSPSTEDNYSFLDLHQMAAKKRQRESWVMMHYYYPCDCFCWYIQLLKIVMEKKE